MIVRCPTCSRELPSAFPGSTVRCECGTQTTLPDVSTRTTSAGGDGPYRVAGAPTRVVPSEICCPYCSRTCPSTLRVCPNCDVRFDSVRCSECYSLQSPGSFACFRCGRALELEPFLDATDAPCPRCSRPLEVAGGHGEDHDARLHECPRCGGVFVPREVLAEILCRAELRGPLPEEAREPAKLERVTYVPCPLCRSTMNRMNFGKVSGVIVDVCRAHGTWFDAGELTRVVAFASNKGLERTRAREAQEKLAAKQQAAVLAKLAAVNPPPSRFALRRYNKDRYDAWRQFLSELFFW